MVNVPGGFKGQRIMLLEYVRARRLDGVALFESCYVLYFTGFAYIPTERPIAFVMNAKGENVDAPYEDTASCACAAGRPSTAVGLVGSRSTGLSCSNATEERRRLALWRFTVAGWTL